MVETLRGQERRNLGEVMRREKRGIDVSSVSIKQGHWLSALRVFRTGGSVPLVGPERDRSGSTDCSVAIR
jgi:hypothetical protein